MFTGIIEGRGVVLELLSDPENDSAVLRIQTQDTKENPTSDVVHGLELGASIAVDGVCLTATRIDGSAVSLDVMGETLQRTTLGELAAGSLVNLERCVRAGDRLDGHVVQGHVDGVGHLVERQKEGNWERLRFSVPRQLSKYIAEKGSIAIDGVSLTVTAVSTAQESDQWFEVGLIPTTLAATGLGSKAINAGVNLEVDVLAKYAERLGQFGSAALAGGQL